MAERKAYNFYASYWQQLKLLKNKQRLDMFDAICSVQFLEVNINDIKFKDPICNLVWTGIKHSVSSSLYGFINKNKGLDNQVIEPLAKGGIEPPTQQEEGEEKEEVQEKGKGEYIPDYVEFKDYAIQNKPDVCLESLRLKYDAWLENDWKDGNDRKIKNWKTKILNTLKFLGNGQTTKNNNKGFKSDSTDEAIRATINAIKGNTDS